MRRRGRGGESDIGRQILRLDPGGKMRWTSTEREKSESERVREGERDGERETFDK